MTDTPNELVERVAEAIIRAGVPPPLGDSRLEYARKFETHTWRNAMRDATAALEASGIEAQQAEIARLREALRDLCDLDERCGWHSKQLDAARAELEGES